MLNMTEKEAFKVYTVEEVAKILKFTEKTIRDMLASGRLKGSKVGRQWRISEDQLKEFFK